MNTPTKAKKSPKVYTNQNPLEALKGISTGVRDSFTKDLAGDSMGAMWEQFFGASEQKNQRSGDLSEGQEISFNKKKKEEKSERSAAAPALDYHREIVDAEKRVSRETQQGIHSQIQEILIELKKISETSTEIAMEFKEVTIEQRIENPGEYHVSFFSWMLSVVRAARARIEDSGAWLNTMKSKKGQKNYWAMFKKHGTTFGMSNERMVATQTG